MSELPPLGRFLGQELLPGTNLKGDAPKATWRFLLPDPAPPAITIVGDATPAELDAFGPEVRVEVVRDPRGSPLAGSVVLVRRGDPQAIAAGTRNATVAWEERGGRPRTTEGQAYRLTPDFGEIRTAVPWSDETGWRQHLASRRDAVTVGLATLERLRRRGMSGVAGPGGTGGRSRRRALLRGAGIGAVETVAAIERWSRRHGGKLDRRFVVHGPRAGGSLPAYLGSIVGDDPVRWWLQAPGDYRTQKLLVHLELADGGGIIVKVGRDAATSDRLRHAAAMLDALAERPAGEGVLPSVAVRGVAGPHAIIGEHRLDGVPFEDRSDGSAASPEALAAVAALAGLSQRRSPEPVLPAVERVSERFREAFPDEVGAAACLRDDLAELAAMADPERPLAVVMHGDPGTWNLLVGDDGRVALLDWENGEPHGIPTWDMWLFLHAYALHHDRRAGEADRWAVVDRHLVGRSPLAPLLEHGIRTGAAAAGLAPRSAVLLLSGVLAYQALKERPRLTPGARGVWLHALARWASERRRSWLTASAWASAPPAR